MIFIFEGGGCGVEDNITFDRWDNVQKHEMKLYDIIFSLYKYTNN